MLTFRSWWWLMLISPATTGFAGEGYLVVTGVVPLRLEVKTEIQALAVVLPPPPPPLPPPDLPMPESTNSVAEVTPPGNPDAGQEEDLRKALIRKLTEAPGSPVPPVMISPGRGIDFIPPAPPKPSTATYQKVAP